MDKAKCKRLKEELANEPEPQIIPIEQFFDGNDDIGSIGCNLSEHPGMNVFRDTLVALMRRPDVEAVYAQIAELDPGEDIWPFTDTVFVAGSISDDELRELLEPLQPDEVGPAATFGAPEWITDKHGEEVLAAWWD
jgi:hypothetical protein